MKKTTPTPPAPDSAPQALLFFLLTGIVIYLVGNAVISYAPNMNSWGGASLSFLCAVPLAILLFANNKFAARVKPYQRVILPALIFPLFIVLSLGWNLYQQFPPNLFRVFIMDPIPEGITHIRGRDITVGFDNLELVFVFNITPQALDEFIVKNELVEAEHPDMGGPNAKAYFRKTGWNETWTAYGKIEKAHRNTVLTISVSPDGKTICCYFIIF